MWCGRDRALHPQRSTGRGGRWRICSKPEIIKARTACVAYARSVALPDPIQLTGRLHYTRCQFERGVLLDERGQRRQRDVARFQFHCCTLLVGRRVALRTQCAALLDLQRGFEGDSTLGGAADILCQHADALQIKRQRRFVTEILKRHRTIEQLDGADFNSDR